MKATTKKQLLAFCQKRNDARLQEIMHAMAQAQEAIESDTKSSAGDKYETSREMIQQDMNRFQQQLMQAKKDAVVLQKIELEPKKNVALGSLVVTDAANYFIAISLGKQQIEGFDYTIISPSSPIGQLLIEQALGYTLQFNGLEQTIVAIY